MNYQLEREMRDRVSRYHQEAAVRRSLQAPLRAALADRLRKWANRLDPVRQENWESSAALLRGEHGFRALHSSNPLQGRND